MTAMVRSALLLHDLLGGDEPGEAEDDGRRSSKSKAQSSRGVPSCQGDESGPPWPAWLAVRGSPLPAGPAASEMRRLVPRRFLWERGRSR